MPSCKKEQGERAVGAWKGGSALDRAGHALRKAVLRSPAQTKPVKIDRE